MLTRITWVTLKLILKIKNACLTHNSIPKVRLSVRSPDFYVPFVIKQ